MSALLNTRLKNAWSLFEHLEVLLELNASMPCRIWAIFAKIRSLSLQLTKKNGLKSFKNAVFLMNVFEKMAKWGMSVFFHTRLRMSGDFANILKCFWSWMQACHVGFSRFSSINSLTIAFSLPSKMAWNASKMLIFDDFFKKMVK